MTAQFYDQLAPHYHLLYADWDDAIARQGAALAALLECHGVNRGAPILDAAAGVGTQAIGLAAAGFRVSASDISEGAIRRLELELAARKLVATTFVDDMRELSRVASASMAAVLACDNSIPHLLSDADILQAFETCHRCLSRGGVLVISVRDYDSIDRRNPDICPYGMRRLADGTRFLALQAWEWDGDWYDMRMYLITESLEGTCSTVVATSRYYAISLVRLAALMREAGFSDVERRDDVLFQPVLIGRRRE